MTYYPLTGAYVRSHRAIGMSEGTYVRYIAFFTLVVAGIVALSSVVSYGWTFHWVSFLLLFLAAVGCIFMFLGSDKPIISFIGVSGLSGILGLMTGPVLRLYQTTAIIEAVVITGVIMGVMSFMGIVFPQIFRGWGPYLLAGLTLLIVAQFAQIICIMIGFPQAGKMPFLTWAGIALFAGYVACDWSEALDKPHTLDNAIDASGGLILDAVNIFLRVLGSKSRD